MFVFMFAKILFVSEYLMYSDVPLCYQTRHSCGDCAIMLFCSVSCIRMAFIINGIIFCSKQGSYHPSKIVGSLYLILSIQEPWKVENRDGSPWKYDVKVCEVWYESLQKLLPKCSALQLCYGYNNIVEHLRVQTHCIKWKTPRWAWGKQALQCFDTVGWATGRASGL